jgi:hypothetical protein
VLRPELISRPTPALSKAEKKSDTQPFGQGLLFLRDGPCACGKPCHKPCKQNPNILEENAVLGLKVKD